MKEKETKKTQSKHYCSIVFYDYVLSYCNNMDQL